MDADDKCGFGCETVEPYGFVPAAGCPTHDDKGRQCGRPWPHLSHVWMTKDYWCPGKTSGPPRIDKRQPIVVEPDDA